jgi:hypothetical protein
MAALELIQRQGVKRARVGRNGIVWTSQRMEDMKSVRKSFMAKPLAEMSR